MNRAELTLLRRLNAVCPYYTMFPLDFPMDSLGAARQGDWVLDPFCGRGSTNYAARMRNLPSVGIDSNPVAVAIAKAKLAHTTPARVITACRRILQSRGRPAEVPTGAFWSRAFHKDTLVQICKLREALMKDCSSDSRIALRAMLLGRLHGPKTKRRKRSYLSNQMPRTYASKPGYAVGFWRERKMWPPKVSVLELIERKAPDYFAANPSSVEGRIVRGDSRTINIADYVGCKASWVITSPPYYGMRTYVPDQWLRYWFVGGPSAVPYQFTGQLNHGSPDVFAKDLALVWANVARSCKRGARMVIRFGGIPDRAANPLDILKSSLRVAGCGWRISTIRAAGTANPGKRQASQFLLKASKPVQEFDLYARLQSKQKGTGARRLDHARR